MLSGPENLQSLESCVKSHETDTIFVSRTCLGPRSMLKMILGEYYSFCLARFFLLDALTNDWRLADPMGGILLTNDGTIFP
jgi:hypothetical protein